MRVPLLLVLPLLGVLSACSEPYDPTPLASTGSATPLSTGTTVAQPLPGARCHSHSPVHVWQWQQLHAR